MQRLKFSFRNYYSRKNSNFLWFCFDVYRNYFIYKKKSGYMLVYFSSCNKKLLRPVELLSSHWIFCFSAKKTAMKISRYQKFRVYIKHYKLYDHRYNVKFTFDNKLEESVATNSNRGISSFLTFETEATWIFFKILFLHWKFLKILFFIQK